MLRAVFIGAVSALAIVVLLAVLHGVVFGINTPWDKQVAHGWQGGVNGLKIVVAAGAAFWWFFPAVGLSGAVVGILLHWLRSFNEKN